MYRSMEKGILPGSDYKLIWTRGHQQGVACGEMVDRIDSPLTEKVTE